MKHLKHAWSKNGKDYTAAQLKKHLIDEILPYQDFTPPIAKVNLPTRGFDCQLGTVAADVKIINDKNRTVIAEVKDKGMKQAKEMKLDANLQPSMPEIDANLIGKKIQYNFEMDVIELGG